MKYEESDLQVYQRSYLETRGWLERAKGEPLSIQVERFAIGCKEYGDESIWDEILARFKQWKFLDINCPNETGQFEKLLNCLKQPHPLLEIFFIRPCGCDDRIEWLNDTTLTAPNLSQILLFGSEGFLCPLSAMTVFVCIWLRCEDILRHLRCMNRLVHCTIYKPTGENALRISSSKIELEYAEKFSYSPSSDAAYIVGSLSLPALRELSVKYYLTAPTMIKECLALLRRSRFPSWLPLVETLHVTNLVDCVPQRDVLDLFQPLFISSLT